MLGRGRYCASHRDTGCSLFVPVFEKVVDTEATISLHFADLSAQLDALLYGWVRPAPCWHHSRENHGSSARHQAVLVPK